MKNSLKLDPFSLLVTVPISRTLSRLQKELKSLGYMVGYSPRKRGSLTLRMILERRIPNRWSLRYGEIDDLCVRLKATRKGHVLVTHNVPRSATGPDFKKILIGSGRSYGRMTESTLAVVPIPETTKVMKIRLPQKLKRDTFLKKFWASGIRPRAFTPHGRSEFHIELEGTRELVSAELAALDRILTQGY